MDQLAIGSINQEPMIRANLNLIVNIVSSKVANMYTFTFPNIAVAQSLIVFKNLKDKTYNIARLGIPFGQILPYEGGLFIVDKICQ